MKAYKVEVLVLDFDRLGSAGLKQVLENASFPNDCASLDVKEITERDIGPWDDDHPLNKAATKEAEYQRLFAQQP